MAVSLYLGVRLAPQSFQKIKIEDIDLGNKVEVLKDEAANKLKVNKQNLELCYCGNILEDNEPLSSYDLKPGVMVHVIKKKAPQVTPYVRVMNEADIQSLVMAFRTFKLSSNYRTALQRLSRPEVLDNIIATTPGLSEDPVAVSMLQDSDLLVHMTDAETVRRIAELHPGLAEAAGQIAAAVHDEAAGGSAPGPSTGYSYSLEALSDDEEMDSSSSEGQSARQLAGSVTAAHLAAALASASGNGSSSAHSEIITREMFSNAMQQAFANVQTPVQAPVAPNESGGEESLDQIARRFMSQMQQMRELGLTNVATNIQALNATNGDVQAAIDLVFSGAIPNDL